MTQFRKLFPNQQAHFFPLSLPTIYGHLSLTQISLMCFLFTSLAVYSLIPQSFLPCLIIFSASLILLFFQCVSNYFDFYVTFFFPSLSLIILPSISFFSFHLIISPSASFILFLRPLTPFLTLCFFFISYNPSLLYFLPFSACFPSLYFFACHTSL